MRPITKETIDSIHSFMTNLNSEQLQAYSDRLLEKQPEICGYFMTFVDGSATMKELAHFQVILFFIIRGYEYEYGEMEFIDDKIVEAHNAMIFKYITQEVKRKSSNTVIREIYRMAAQQEFIEFLKSIVEGELIFPEPFGDEVKPKVNLGIYSLMIMFNQIIESKEKE